MVEEILEVDPAKLVPAPAPLGRALAGAMLRHHGEAVPLIPLQGALQVRGGQGARPPKALLVRHNGAPVAFGVDRLVGQQEVVVRPLEDPLVKVRAVAGATDLGDGRPVLVLDLLALGASVSHGSAA